jgi:hypothetical protein
MLVGVGNSSAELTPLSPRLRALKASNSVCEVTLQLNLLLNLSSMAQIRTDITFGNLGSGIQIGINNGPIHLPSGTSLRAKPD